MQTRRSIPFAALLLLTASLSQAAPETAPTQPAVTQSTAATVHKVERGTLSFVIEAIGTFEPVEPFEVRLRPEAYKGELTVVSAAANGAPVKKGDVLLECDPADLTPELEAARNEQTKARANLSKAEADAKLGAESDALALRIQEEEVKNAKDALKWWDEVTGPQLLENAALAVRQAAASVEDQEDELEQLRKMYKSEDLTSATADIVIKRALRQLEISKIGLKMQREQEEKTKASDHPVFRQKVANTVEQAARQLDQLRATQAHATVQRGAEVKSAQLALAAAEKRVGELGRDVAALTVRAPHDGVAFYGQLVDGAWQNADPRTLRPGEVIGAGGTVMTVAAPGKLAVTFDVPEAKLAWLRPELKASVQPVAFPGLHYKGTCAPLRPAGKGGPEQSFAWKVNVGEVDARVAPGMKASVRVDAGEAKDVLLVPVGAVVHGTARVRGADGEEDDRAVTVGRSDGERVEIRAGLKEGDEVIVGGRP